MSKEAAIRIYNAASISTCPKLTLFVDGQQFGTIDNYKEQIFQLSLGKHSIFLKSPIMPKTDTIEFNLATGDTKSFEYGIVRKFLIRIFSLIACVFVGSSVIGCMSSHQDAFIGKENLILSLGAVYLLLMLALVVLLHNKSHRPGGIFYLKEVPDRK